MLPCEKKNASFGPQRVKKSLGAGCLWRRVLDTNMLVSVTQKSRVGCRRKKSGSGYEHLPVRMQHIIDRLKFLEPYRHVGRPTQSTLARLEESNVQPMPTQRKGKKAKSTSSESDSGSDEKCLRLWIRGKKPFNILVELLTNLIGTLSSPEHFILFFVQFVCYKLKPVHIVLFFPINALRVKKTNSGIELSRSSNN